MPARRTKKVAPRKVAGARRAKAVSPRAKVKPARKAAAKPLRKAAAKPPRKAAAKPARKAAAKPRKAAASSPARRATAAPKARAAKLPTRATMVRELERGCDAVLASMRGMPAGAAERPIAPGKWSPMQILVHLAYWDEWMLGLLPAAITRNRRPSPMSEAQIEQANAQAIALGANLAWDDARSLWATQRALLLGLLAAVPAAPLARWAPEHALGSLLDGYASHDLHHAAQLRNARKAKRGAFTPAFSQQAQGASAKELLLFELQRGRVAVMAALQGMGGATAARPVDAGKWSPREIVLHLSVRDRVRLEEFDALLQGAAPSWDPTDYHGMDDSNEAHLASLRERSWDEALRLLDTTRARLVSALLAAPAEPAERWTAAHPFGATMLELPRHDRHHAEQIKNARISS